MNDAKGIDPALSAADFAEAENRRQMLEEQIKNMLANWHEKLGEVRDKAEHDLSTIEVKEYQARIAVL